MNVRLRFPLCLLFVFSFLLATTPSWGQSPAQLFQQAKNTYTFGDYKKAVALFRNLLYPKPGKLKSKFMRQEAQKYLGISYYYLYGEAAVKATTLQSKNKPVPKALLDKQRLRLKRARFELLNYLASNPDATLSPLIYPSDLVSLFNKLRKINKLRLSALNIKKTRKKLVRLKLVHTKLERRLFKTSPYAMLLPCGMAQLANGHHAKGALILVGCAVTLATNLTTYGILVSEQKEPGRFATGFVSTARALRVTHFIALGAFAALVVYGYVDGIYYYRRRRETLLPHIPSLQLKEISKASPPTSPILRAQFR